MKRSPIDHVKHLIKRLTAEERREIVPYLSQFSDSGVQSYDLSGEVQALKKHGIKLPPDGSPTEVSIVFIKDLVEIYVADRKVVHARFFPERFAEGYSNYMNQRQQTAEAYKEHLFTPEKKGELRAARISSGIQESDEEFEAEIDKACRDVADIWVPEKGTRIAERISKHFPGMVADMVVAAIKGQTFYDLHEATKELSPERPLPSVKGIKKAVQDIAWRDL